MSSKLLVIDNYDSFTYNLVQMFREYDLHILIRRNDEISLAQVEKFDADYIVISPGPKNPHHAGISVNLIETFHEKTPILGVCLGMQCINEAFEGKTIQAPEPVHGKTSLIEHNARGIFKGIPPLFRAARYHSLIVEPGDDELEITSRSNDGVIMGLSHKRFPLHGVQFHPESFLTDHGFLLIKNFLKLGPLKDLFSNDDKNENKKDVHF